MVIFPLKYFGLNVDMFLVSFLSVYVSMHALVDRVGFGMGWGSGSKCGEEK